MNSEVLQFYEGAHILITGGTGFMGKVLVEKLLRTCRGIEKLYLLIRSKKGKEPKDRLKELFQNPLFDCLKQEFPNFLEHIIVIPGDCSKPHFDLPEAELLNLAGKITHVFHNAAVVKFDEVLRQAITLNVITAQQVLQFCHMCTNLKVVIHMSTAYSHCYRSQINEEVYDAPMTGQRAIELLECFNDEKLNELTPEIIKPWPNTYTYTKAIGEEMAISMGQGLPIGIFRPSIVVHSAYGPIKGWIDNFYGPSGIVAGVGAGLIHTACSDHSKRFSIVPVDMSVNAIICTAWDTAAKYKTLNKQECHESSTSPEVPIYNYVESNTNSITVGQFHELFHQSHQENPTVVGIWYDSLTTTKSWFLYVILKFLMHLLPAFLMDTGLFLLGKKPKMLDSYKRVHKMMDSLIFFATNEWTFGDDNTRKLWKSLSKTDQDLFAFDMASLNWKQFFVDGVVGVKRFLFKDFNTDLRAAKRRMLMLYVAHRTLQVLIVGMMGWTFYFLLTSLNVRI